MIDAAGLLDEANELAKTAHGREIRRRTALSRAYYAAYHRAAAAARSAGFRFSARQGRGMHAALISFLTQSGNPDFVAAAGLLGSLKGLRTLADYDLNATVTMGQLRDVLEEADYLLTELLPSDAA